MFNIILNVLLCSQRRFCSDENSFVFVFCSQLVLRKWSELIPGGEFRCFVKENKLIGKNCCAHTQTIELHLGFVLKRVIKVISYC